MKYVFHTFCIIIDKYYNKNKHLLFQLIFVTLTENNLVISLAFYSHKFQSFLSLPTDLLLSLSLSRCLFISYSTAVCTTSD